MSGEQRLIQMGCDEFLVKGTDNRHLLEILCALELAVHGSCGRLQKETH